MNLTPITTLRNRMRLWWPLVAAVVTAAWLLVPMRSGPAALAQGELRSTPASASAGPLVLSAQAEKDAGIETSAARVIERRDRLDAPGVVGLNERRTARIGAVAEGVVVDVPVQPGDSVQEGTQLATVLSHLFHDAWASYFKALAARRTGEREVAYARAAQERAARLLRDKALSPQEADRAAADSVHAEQALAAAKAEVTRTEQDLRHYGIVPREDADPEAEDRIAIRAPFAGVVIERLVSTGTTVTPGVPLLVVSDLSTVWVSVEVDEAHLAQLARGRAASVTAAAYPGQAFAGTIDAVGDVINPSTRRVAVRVVVPNADRRLKPEMFVTATLGTSEARRALVVSSRAVQQLDGETVVFVKGAEGYARRPVVLGGEADGVIEVVRGLSDGERVVTNGAFLLKSSMTAQAGEP